MLLVTSYAMLQKQSAIAKIRDVMLNSLLPQGMRKELPNYLDKTIYARF
jgi:hypothetical protein